MRGENPGEGGSRVAGRMGGPRLLAASGMPDAHQ